MGGLAHSAWRWRRAGCTPPWLPPRGAHYYTILFVGVLKRLALCTTYALPLLGYSMAGVSVGPTGLLPASFKPR